MLSWVLALGFFAAPAPALAPSVADLDRSLDRVEALLVEAERVEASWSQLQRSWVDGQCAAWRCPRDVGVPLAAAQIDGARSTRRYAQSARAELRRAEQMLAFDTVAPLAGEERRRRLAALTERVDRSSAAYSTRLAWHERYVAAWARAYRRDVERQRCAPSP